MEWKPGNNVAEYVICAAIWYNDGIEYPHQPKNIPVGMVVCGRRHHNCFPLLHRAYGDNMHKSAMVQGFLTSKDRFVDRNEGGAVAFEIGQIDEATDCMFSEDLY